MRGDFRLPIYDVFQSWQTPQDPVSLVGFLARAGGQSVFEDIYNRCVHLNDAFAVSVPIYGLFSFVLTVA